MTDDVLSYRQYAADCLRQAEDESTPVGRTILLNVALAWLRLAQQTQDVEEPVPAPSGRYHHDLHAADQPG